LPANIVHPCDCGQSVDDLEHFILHCSQYDIAHQKLISVITNVWNDSKNSGQKITVILQFTDTNS